MAQHRKSWVETTLVIVLVLQCALAIDQCKTGCAKDSGILNLKPGTTYKYDYDGKINIQLSSAENQQTSTEVKAQVLLTQQADCSQVLKLQNVQIIGPDGKPRVGIPDVEKPIVLNSNNGDINDFICAEQGDTQNSLNLKRAIASLFQTNPNKNTEIDVFGQCPTHITKSQDGDIITISKSKNLNKCAFRESITHSFISSAFDLNSKIKTSPVLDSYLTSQQKIKAGVLDSANVVENYLFVPFSVGQNGAKATIESKLLLTGTGSDNPTTKCQVPKSIIFENPHPVNLQKTNVNVLLSKVKKISEKLQTNVEDTTAIQFIELVKLLRVSKKTDILSVYNQVRSGVGFTDKLAAKKIFLDAILTAGNGDTIQVAIELLKNKELDIIEERQLYIGLTRARHVTEASIKTATDLLNRANLPREAYLGIGALAGRYCAHHSCENVDAINRIIQKFLSKLGDLKAANRKEESDMIFVLKGLTNVGYLNDAILSKLVSLAEDKNQPIRLRVATLEAFTASPCKDQLRNSALKTLKDIQEDSEIRIKAYLVLTHCPNDQIGNAIKALLETEPSNQVGGYISSHIKNLRSSANPDKELAKTHLGFIHTPSRFVIDPRKYSINGEFSHSVNALGVANNVEGNIIYSQNSWLPRSANLNLTAEVFGQRFNFLEIAARQENLDKVLEHYLGPKGVLRKATVQQNFDNFAKPVQKLFQNLKEKVDKSLRARRDVSKADIDAINEKVQIKTNELDKNFDLDFSVKNFGSEVVFMNSFDLTDKLSTQNIIDNFVSKLNEGLDKLKSFEKTLRANLLILDAELTYPTSLGFPLRLGLDGASNIQIKSEGNIDVRSLLAKSAENDVNFKLSVIPSATITIIGRFSLDTPVLENGLKVASTIHTSTGGDLIVSTFNGGLGLDVKFTTPVEKQELIGFKHDIIFQSKENGVVVNNQRLKFSQNKDFSICIDHLVSYVGLEFCADINGPNLSGKKVPILPFPFSGDAKASIRIERGDIDTFHYRREFIASKDGKRGVEATLETYGKNSKGVSVNVQGYIAPEKYLKVILNSPIKNGEAEARLISNKKEKLISVYVKDEVHLYSAKAGMSVEGGGNKFIYKPVLEYTTPDKKGPQIPPFHVEGQILSESLGGDVRYHLDHLKLVIPGRKDLTLTGVVGTHGPGYLADVTLSDGSNSASLEGNLVAQPQLLKLEAKLKNSMNPNLNFNFKGELKKNKGLDHVSSHIQLTHGNDLNSKTNTLTLVNLYTLKNPGKDAHLITKNKLTYPLLKLNTKFDLERTPKSLFYDVLFNYGEIKLGSEFKININTKSVGDYQLELKANGLKNHVEVKSSRIVIGVDESKIANSLVLNGKKLEVLGKVKHHVKPHDLNIGSDLVIKLPNSKSPWKLNEGLRLTTKDLDLHIKLLNGNSPLIDTVLKANIIGNVNGHIKVDVKEILHINGNIKAQKGVGNGNILVDAKSIKKSAKLETSFNIHNPLYNLDVTLYPVFNEDKNKKIALSTKNKLTGTALDSSSTLDVLGSKVILNAKGQIGSPVNGKTLIDVDLTLPSQQYIAAKLVRDVSSNNGVLNIDSLVSLEQRSDKASPGRKITVKGVAKNTNFKEGILDITINANADDSAGHNVNVDLAVKRQKNGDKYVIDVNNKITSSLLKDPIETTYNGECKGLTGKFSLKTTACEKTSGSVQGTYNLNVKEGPLSGEVSLDVQTPLEILSSIKTTQNIKISNLKTEAPISVEYLGDLSTVSSIPRLTIDGKGSFKICGNKQTGQIEYHGELVKPIQTSLDASGSFNVDVTKKSGTVKGDFKATLPENKVIQGSSLLTRDGPSAYHLEASLDLPIENHKSNKIIVDTKHNEVKDISSQVQLITDGQKYLLNTELSLNRQTPSVSLKLVKPDGKISELTANLNRQNESRLLANLKVLCGCSDFLLEGGLDVNSENLDNFYVQVTANSPKLNINDILVKIGNAAGNDGQGLNILVTSAGKNVVSGSATVSSRQEHGKFIVEGSGNFKLNDKDQSGNFKYIRTTLTSDQNGETGEEINFDATLGNRAIDAELKLTNKEFRYLNSYCEESKQCAHIEVNAKTDVNDLEHFNNQIEVTIDLRVLGIPNEFGLKAVTKRDKLILDHTVDVHFENALNKYQYSVYVHPTQAGIFLATPKRTIALEANGDVKDLSLQEGGKANVEIAFYTDKKNNPNSKSSLKGIINVDVPKKHIDVEIDLIAVGQTKPLTIKYTKDVKQEGLTSEGSQQLILDIFALPEQKIVADHQHSAKFSRETYRFEGKSTLNVKSSGLGIDINVERNALLDPKAFTVSYQGSSSIAVKNIKHDSVLKLVATPKDVNVLLKLLNKVLIQVDSDITFQKGLINVNTLTTGLGLKPVQSLLEIKNYNTVKLTQYLKDDPSNKLLVTAALIPGQIADARAVLSTGGANKELFHASIQLDEKNFLHPDSAFDNNNIKEFAEKARQVTQDQLTQLSANIKEGAQGLTDDLKEIGNVVKETIPDLSKSQEFYQSELNKIKEEIAADKSLEQFAEVLRSTVQVVISTVSEIITNASNIIEKVFASLNAAFSGTIQTIQTQILPKLKEVLDQVVASLKVVGDKLSDVIFAYLAKISEVIDIVQPQIKAIVASLSEISEELQRFIVKSYESIRTAIIEEIKHIKDELKASPLIEKLKVHYQALLKEFLPSQEVIVNTLRAASGALKEVAIFPEFQNFIDLVERYLEKKLTNQPVDDVAELEKIVARLIQGLRRLTAVFTTEILPDIVNKIRVPQINVGLLKRFQIGSGDIKVSVLDYILKEDTKPIIKFLFRLVFIPKDFLIPRTLYGEVSSEIFSFDGKVFSLPSSCSFLLARDAVNGNFSIVAEYVDQKLNALTYSDKTTTVTIKEGKVLLDNVEADYPIEKGDVHVHYLPSMYLLKSSAGVKILCSLQMVGCGIQISGFYHGQLRGLFGNGNNEEFDDFILSDGKIATTASEFVSSYALGSQCPKVAAVEGKDAKPDPGCEELFSWSTSLKTCYPFVDRTRFKRGCEISVAAGNKEAYFTYAAHYAYACWKDNIPAVIPADLAPKCENSLVPHNVDEKFSFKLPGKSADIMLMVNVDKASEVTYKEYIQPLVTKLTEEYKTKGITDLKFQLLTYGGEHEKSTYVTVKGSPSFTGSAPELKFSERPKPFKFVTGIPDVDSTIRHAVSALTELKVALGGHLPLDSHLESISYPFRAESIKQVIYLANEPCPNTAQLVLLLARAPVHVKKEIFLTYITPLDLKVKDAKISKEIIGFDSDKVYTLSNPTGSSDLTGEVVYENICSDHILAVGGINYVRENLLANKNNKDKVLDIIAKNIIAKTVTKEIEVECTCGYSYLNPFTPYNRCRAATIL
ncbi:apolipophorins-like [Coccinella septempunctata]|uniref:apolipophorins-like n=1 Tax=Coccinella septempunctata TaxID=41139 RepID=UPI001D0752DB|nr:apolipophorins-like [Coccinella septempunctata]